MNDEIELSIVSDGNSDNVFKHRRMREKTHKSIRKRKLKCEESLAFQDGESHEALSTDLSADQSVSEEKSKSEGSHGLSDEVPVNTSMPSAEAITNKESKAKKILEPSDEVSVDASLASLRIPKKKSKTEENLDGLHISINDLKQQIMGREVHVDNGNDDIETQPKQLVLSSNTDKEVKETDTAQSVANSLLRDLSYAICHEPFYQPISMPCGHTFCQE